MKFQVAYEAKQTNFSQSSIQIFPIADETLNRQSIQLESSFVS